MANRERGEVAASFKGEEISLVLDFNTMCDLEDRFDQPIEEIMQRLDDDGGKRKVEVRDLRAVFHVLLQGARADATARDAGEFLTELGIEGAGELLGKLVERSGIAGDGGQDKRPPAKAGGKKRPS